MRPRRQVACDPANYLIHSNSRRAQLLHGSFRIARLSIDGSGGVEIDYDVETRPVRIEGRGFHAVVQRQADNVDFAYAVIAEHPLELGAFEPGVTLQVGCLARVYDRVDPLAFEARVKLSPFAALHAMHRPGPSVGPEGIVVGRVPVSGRYYESRLAGEAVDRLNDGIAVRNGERPAGAKVVLDIDDDQRIYRVSH